MAVDHAWDSRHFELLQPGLGVTAANSEDVWPLAATARPKLVDRDRHRITSSPCRLRARPALGRGLISDSAASNGTDFESSLGAIVAFLFRSRFQLFCRSTRTSSSCNTSDGLCRDTCT